MIVARRYMFVIATVLIVGACGSVSTTPSPTSTSPSATLGATPASTQASLSTTQPPPPPTGPTPSFAIKSTDTKNGATTTDLTFDGGRPTDAYLVGPASAAPGSAAGIVWFHWSNGDAISNRSEFLGEAQTMAAQGVVSVLIDGVFPWHDTPVSASHDLAAVQAQVQALKDARELLRAQAAVDPSRVALVGHDFGAMYSSVLFGMDPTIAALVVMTPTARWADWFLPYWPHSDDPAAYKAALQPLDPVTELPNANGRPVLLQFAKNDQYVSSSTAAEMTTAAGSGAERQDYATGHQLDAAAQADRDAWVAQILHLKPGPSPS